jgi:hypothetical protein
VDINVGEFNNEDVDEDDEENDEDEDEGNTVEENTLLFDVFGKGGASFTLRRSSAAGNRGQNL